MWDSTPWFVGGGAHHSPEVARLLAYAASSGAEGVVTPEALRVQPLAVPGGAVRIAPGACLMLNRYPGGGWQTYVGRNPVQHDVQVTPTGSAGGRTDLVVARVLDPQYEGSAPSDPVAFQYMRTEVIQGVPAGTTSARELNLNYPALALARITLPASTGTVQASHITDLRKVAQARSQRLLFTRNLTGPDVHALTTTGPVGQYWPDTPDPMWQVDIPEWATSFKVVVHYGGVRVSYSGAEGVWWVRLGHADGYVNGNVRTQDQKWALDPSARPNEELRESWSLGDTIAIPARLRGTRVPVRVLGRVLQSGGPPRLDNASSITVDVEFSEEPA